MFINLNGEHFRLIGDPHLGRVFRNGVSLHRRGEREEGQFTQFKRELNDIKTPGGDQVKAVIVMGDIFDTFFVEDNVKRTTCDAIELAARRHPEVDYIVLRGNHDCTRDTGRESSFSILAAMLTHLNNVYFIAAVTMYHHKAGKEVLMFFPYDEFQPTSELKMWHGGAPVAAAFGHWDMTDIGGDHNLIPVKELFKMTKRVYNGHVHTPGIVYFNETGELIPHDVAESYPLPLLMVTKTGSMQPYSHGEDPTGKIYVTMKLDEFLDETIMNPNAFTDKALRLRVPRGADVPKDIDCLQLTIQYIDEEGDDEKPETEVKMEEFSFETLFKSSFAELSEETADYWWKKYLERNGNDTQS